MFSLQPLQIFRHKIHHGISETWIGEAQPGKNEGILVSGWKCTIWPRLTQLVSDRYIMAVSTMNRSLALVEMSFSECFLSQDLTSSWWRKGGVGGDTRMKSGMAIKVTPPTIISVFQARGFLGSLPSIHSSRNYHIHVTDKELAQLDLKSFFPDSRSPAFFPYTLWPLGRSLSCPILQLGILRPGIGAFDGVQGACPQWVEDVWKEDTKLEWAGTVMKLRQRKCIVPHPVRLSRPPGRSGGDRGLRKDRQRWTWKQRLGGQVSPDGRAVT